MKSKVILKWTKWFYRALVVLIVVLMNIGPWMYNSGYNPYGGIVEVMKDIAEYKRIYVDGYTCFGVIMIGLIMLILSFIKSKKFKFFIGALVVSIIIVIALTGAGIIIPILYDCEISKVWWMADVTSVLLLISTVIGRICETKALVKNEADVTTEPVSNDKKISMITAIVYGIVTLVVVIVSVVIVDDKGWRIEDDTLYLERELGIYHFFDDDETLWGKGEFKELKVENGVREIQYIGLCNNEDFEEVDLPKSLRVIGEFAFSDCKNLYEIDIPNKVEKIEWAAFWECENLSQIELSENLEIIEGRAFYGCKELSYINLPKDLEVIGEYAFEYCDSLKSITIPRNVKEIGDNAFPKDTVLTVGYDSYAEQWAIENGYTYEIY